MLVQSEVVHLAVKAVKHRIPPFRDVPRACHHADVKALAIPLGIRRHGAIRVRLWHAVVIEDDAHTESIDFGCRRICWLVKVGTTHLASQISILTGRHAHQPGATHGVSDTLGKLDTTFCHYATARVCSEDRMRRGLA